VRRCAGAQEGEDSEDAAVVAGCVAEPELGEDLADVGFHGLGAEEQLVADGLVGVALGHQGEGVAFAVGELGEWAAVVLAGQVLLNAGRTVTAPDGSIDFRAGPQDFLDYALGNTDVVNELCAALGAN
jgi:hypothetical protein